MALTTLSLHAGDGLGSSVAISGDTMVVGAPYDDERAFDAGAAYVFVREGGEWVEQAKLTPLDGTESDWFGTAVAIDGDVVVVGVYLDDPLGQSSGSAYVYRRRGTTWTQEQKLTQEEFGLPDDQVGSGVAISGDTILVGARGDRDGGYLAGAAYVYTFDGQVWNQQQKILAPDPAPSDEFGCSVSLVGDTAVIGAYWDDDLGVDCGSAYVFTRSGTAWSFDTKLVAPDAAGGEWFGWSVSLSPTGDTILVGAPQDDDRGPLSGSVYVFARKGMDWVGQTKLYEPDGAAGDGFGYAVAVHGDRAVVGAPWHADAGALSGAACLFHRQGATWQNGERLVREAPADGDLMGTSVAIDLFTIVVGAPGADTAKPDGGSVATF